jgi:transcriptional regulator with GAF, ATPase, and Fis domain
MNDELPRSEDQTLLRRTYVTRAQRYGILVLSGPDEGRTFELDPSQPFPVFIGTSPSCLFRLTDRAVSRRHVRVELREAAVRVADAGSTNGTRVNGVSVIEADLFGGERIAIGQSMLELQRRNAEFVPLTSEKQFRHVLGASLSLRRLYPVLERLAQSTVPVVVEGETGTGKEVVARSLHEASARSEEAFVVFDCTAVPPSLMESAIFGHAKGAFTGAVSDRKGAFEEADGGTILIDEIGELAPELQTKLLRVLERSEVQRVGSNRWVKTDVRVIAATRRDLDKEVARGRFRDDLFYRLAVARIELPPLRDRDGDVALLARHFWERFTNGESDIPQDFLNSLENYSWPGNVRELQNVVARRVALGDLAPAAMGLARAPANTDDALEQLLVLNLPLPQARERLVREFERRYVERMLERFDGNVMRAAQAAGIAKRYFQMVRARSKRSDDEESDS